MQHQEGGVEGRGTHLSSVFCLPNDLSPSIIVPNIIPFMISIINSRTIKDSGNSYNLPILQNDLSLSIQLSINHPFYFTFGRSPQPIAQYFCPQPNPRPILSSHYQLRGVWTFFSCGVCYGLYSNQKFFLKFFKIFSKVFYFSKIV